MHARRLLTATRLVGAVLVDPLGQVGAPAPAVVQLELVHPVDGQELVAGRAAQPAREGRDRHTDRREGVIGGRRVARRGAHRRDPGAGQRTLDLGQEAGLGDGHPASAPGVEATDHHAHPG